ncbi:hypothetical protein L208DRAFT_1378579 [Tricholoma matsutake]|nr:hypothetical protein L208DRAFT_1378579 [Tricholoma matsutake 945]
MPVQTHSIPHIVIAGDKSSATNVSSDRSSLEYILQQAQVTVFFTDGLTPAVIQSFIKMDDATVQYTHESLAAFQFYTKHQVFVKLRRSPSLPGFEMTLNISTLNLGIICNASDPVIDFVREVTTIEISKPSIILVTIRMCHTEVTQSSLALVKQQDPTGRCTIVVLTAPQLYNNSARPWLDILNGTLERPYYTHCVCLALDPSQRGTIEEDRHNKSTFFQRSSPWANLQLQLSHLLGMDSLVWSLKRLWDDLMDDPNVDGLVMPEVQCSTFNVQML